MSRRPHIRFVKAQLLPGVSFDRVEAAIADELRKVADGDVSQYELDKVVNKYESNALFSNLNNDELASNLAYFEMLGNAEMINEEVERYRATTLGRMADVASALFLIWHARFMQVLIYSLCRVRVNLAVFLKWLRCVTERFRLFVRRAALRTA